MWFLSIYILQTDEVLRPKKTYQNDTFVWDFYLCLSAVYKRRRVDCRTLKTLSQRQASTKPNFSQQSQSKQMSRGFVQTTLFATAVLSSFVQLLFQILFYTVSHFTFVHKTPNVLVWWRKASLRHPLEIWWTMTEWELVHSWCPDQSSGSRETANIGFDRFNLGFLSMKFIG